MYIYIYVYVCTTAGIILMVLPIRSIANVVSKLFQRISSKKLFAQKS